MQGDAAGNATLPSPEKASDPTPAAWPSLRMDLGWVSGARACGAAVLGGNSVGVPDADDGLLADLAAGNQSSGRVRTDAETAVTKGTRQCMHGYVGIWQQAVPRNRPT